MREAASRCCVWPCVSHAGGVLWIPQGRGAEVYGANSCDRTSQSCDGCTMVPRLTAVAGLSCVCCAACALVWQCWSNGDRSHRDNAADRGMHRENWPTVCCGSRHLNSEVPCTSLARRLYSAARCPRAAIVTLSIHVYTAVMRTHVLCCWTVTWGCAFGGVTSPELRWCVSWLSPAGGVPVTHYSSPPSSSCVPVDVFFPIFIRIHVPALLCTTTTTVVNKSRVSASCTKCCPAVFA